ncbi:LysR family transcriptional regulator [bacterium]|nr:LysR family transcriptional regulator [bacterium]
MSIHPAAKLRQIRLFLRMVETGSVTAAARAAGLSQPAASKSLAELESLVGGALFLRQGRRLVLTAEGLRFARHARDAMASLDAAARVMAPVEAETLAIGLLPTVSARFFPRVVSRYLADHGPGPAVTLAIETGAHPVLLRKLRDRHVDLMIGRMPEAPEMEGLDFEFLYEEPIIAVVRAGNPFARLPLPELLRRVPVALPTRDAIIRRKVDDFLAALGMGDLRPAVETSTLALGRGLLLASDAVWFISAGVVEEDVEAGQLQTVALGASYLSGAIGMTTVKGATPPAALLDLCRIVREMAAARRGAGAHQGQSAKLA